MQVQSRIATAQAALERLSADAEEPALSIEEAEAAQHAAVVAEQAAQKTLAEAQRRQPAAQEASASAQRELASARATLADPGGQHRHSQASKQWMAVAQMKRVLFDAALRHQVLRFTCHREHWGDMCVALRSLGRDEVALVM